MIKILNKIFIAISVLFGILFLGYKNGKERQEAQENENILKNVQKAKEIDNNINNLDFNSLRLRMQKWIRKE